MACSIRPERGSICGVPNNSSSPPLPALVAAAFGAAGVREFALQPSTPLQNPENLRAILLRHARSYTGDFQQFADGGRLLRRDGLQRSIGQNPESGHFAAFGFGQPPVAESFLHRRVGGRTARRAWPGLGRRRGLLPLARCFATLRGARLLPPPPRSA